MRLRNIPKADEIVSNSVYCIKNPTQYRGEWFRFFGNERQIFIEIGMGKGQFLIDLANQHPEINYIGIERHTSVLLRAVQKLEKNPLPNLRFICTDASLLPEIFEKGEVDGIYLNFSDPWPKDRHERRRLTSPEYLARYAHILAEDGKIEFKTDNEELFAYSLEQIESSSIWKLDAFTHDLHHDPEMKNGNIMSEYEKKFSGIGHPICKLIASYQDGAGDILPELPDISHQPDVWSTQEPADENSSTEKFTDDMFSECSNGDCLKVSAWPEGTAGENIYSYIIRLEHTGHQSYAQKISLYFSTDISVTEVPGDVQVWPEGNALHMVRNNQLTDNGLTEIWIKLSAPSFPELTGIGNISCDSHITA